VSSRDVSLTKDVASRDVSLTKDVASRDVSLTKDVASRDVLTKRVFLCQLKDLDKNAATGVVYNRSRKARTYSVDAEIFTIYAASLGLTDAPALIPYLGSSSS
jgi:hypothetical protein